MPLRWRSNVRLWLGTVLTAPDKQRLLYPRKRTSPAQERFGVKKRTLNVRFLSPMGSCAFDVRLRG